MCAIETIKICERKKKCVRVRSWRWVRGGCARAGGYRNVLTAFTGPLCNFSALAAQSEVHRRQRPFCFVAVASLMVFGSDLAIRSNSTINQYFIVWFYRWMLDEVRFFMLIFSHLMVYKFVSCFTYQCNSNTVWNNIMMYPKSLHCLEIIYMILRRFSSENSLMRLVKKGVKCAIYN